MRRRSTEAPLSLFSFQDIVTSVAGIMMLAALVLTLEVLTREQLEQHDQTTALDRRTALQTSVQKLRVERDRLAQQLDRRGADAARAAKYTPAAIARELTAEERRAEALSQDIARAEARTKATAGEAASIAGSRAAQEEALEKARQELVRVREELRERKEHSISFEVLGRADKTPVLVECSGAGIRAKILSKPEVTKSFLDENGISHVPSLKAFKRWALEQDRRKVQYVVLIKPTAALYAEALAGELRQAGFKAGYEPMEEEKSAVW